MMTLPQIIDQLRDRRPGMVAEALNVRVSTIIDIREGRTRNPSYETVKALSDYLTQQGS